MIVDIGGGTSDIAVIALNKSDCNGSVRVGGDEMDEAIVRYLRTMYNLCVGESTAEQIKIQIGSASPLEEELTMEVKGLDFIAGMPRTIPIGSAEIREAINEPVTAIIGRSDDLRLQGCCPHSRRPGQVPSCFGGFFYLNSEIALRCLELFALLSICLPKGMALSLLPFFSF